MLNVECLVISLSPLQEIGNLEPKTQKSHMKIQFKLDWGQLKEPQKKPFSYFAKLGFFEKTLEKLKGFSNLLHIGFFYKEPRCFLTLG